MYSFFFPSSSICHFFTLCNKYMLMLPPEMGLKTCSDLMDSFTVKIPIKTAIVLEQLSSPMTHQQFYFPEHCFQWHRYHGSSSFICCRLIPPGKVASFTSTSLKRENGKGSVHSKMGLVLPHHSFLNIIIEKAALVKPSLWLNTQVLAGAYTFVVVYQCIIL